jgi:hypothetical protein
MAKIMSIKLGIAEKNSYPPPPNGVAIRIRININSLSYQTSKQPVIGLAVPPLTFSELASIVLNFKPNNNGYNEKEKTGGADCPAAKHRIAHGDSKIPEGRIPGAG